MASEYINRVAEECGLTPFYIDKKIEDTKELAEEKDLNFSSPILIGYDVQGPMVRLVDTNFYPWVNVQKAVSAIPNYKGISKTIISGWDLKSIKDYRDKRLGRPDINLIGELGAVVEYDGKFYDVEPTPDENIFYGMEQKLFEESAESDLKLAIQGNFSKRVNCFYFEGDERDRGDVRNHFLVKGKNITTKDIYEVAKSLSNEFEYDGKYILFESTLENVKTVDNILRYVHTLQSMRFSKKGDKIKIFRDNKDNRKFTLKEMEEFAKEVIPKDWEIDPNQDYCIDVLYKEDGKKPTKEGAANVLAKMKFDEDYVITNTGDKKGDILYRDNSLFFPQYGTSAHEYCERKKIPNVPVISSVDYSLILAGILRERKREEEKIPEVIPLTAV